MVDIGCNDGTLFDGYAAADLRFLGFDPSDVTRYAVEKGYDVVRDFFSARALRAALRRPPRQGHHQHRDVLRPRGPGGVRRATWPTALAEDGVWVMELHYLPLMLELNAFDVIVHEHLEYYSLAVIERLFAEAGLEVVDGRAQRHQRRVDPAVHRARGPARADARGGRAAPGAARSASSRWRSTRRRPTSSSRATSERVRDELQRAAASRSWREGKTIHVYGASTKGNTILQYAGPRPPR